MKQILFLLLMLVTTAAHSATPSVLRSKTIEASVGVNMTARGPDNQLRQVSGAIKQTIYISSLGRIFTRQTLTSAFSANANDLPVASTASVVGRNMVVPVPLIRGRASARISFDSQFSNCSVQGSVGPGPIKFKGSDGKIYESVSPITFGSNSCSIQAGNAFGG